MPSGAAFCRAIQFLTTPYLPLRYSDSITKAGDNHVNSGNVIHRG
ncbi:hypothetical protein AC15_2501 [Escherichia coli 2-156-04_S3_C2]|nr:hypothetical protein AA98_2545 [Escherichia coli 2-011-08_S1_C1]KDW31518.1 hypothetical protein AC15_2501 [Escherichia coli 2-156-04_S3_C2]